MRKYRKQTQHWRRYKSGRYTLVNKGINYKKKYRKTYGMVVPTFDIYRKKSGWRVQHRFETPADAKEHIRTVGLENVLSDDYRKFKAGKATETMDTTIAQLLHPGVLPAAREAVREMKQRRGSFSSVPILIGKGEESKVIKPRISKDVAKRTGPTVEQVYQWDAVKKINDELRLGFSNWELNEMISGADFGKVLIAVRNHPKVKAAANKVDWKKLTLRR